MSKIRYFAKLILCVALVIASVTLHSQACAQVVGINVVNPLRYSVAEQNDILKQLHDAHVHVIRSGSMSLDDKGVDFIERAYALDIKILFVMSPQYASGGPLRPENLGVMSAHPLSAADPDLSERAYKQLFLLLDEKRIRLAGLELGNEINWAPFNGEFPIPGEGKIMSFADLYHDPEGTRIAKGYLQYLEILKVLKKARDESLFNKGVPIISAGLLPTADSDPLYNDKKEDKVSLKATILFLRANGLDSLVDFYGIHTYPASAKPGDSVANAQRAARFNAVDMGECGTGGDTGKPCWITEWGFPNSDSKCPYDDANVALLIKDMRAVFVDAKRDGRLEGIMYFEWTSDKWEKEPDPYRVYRCNSLSESGRLALSPL